MPTYRYRCAKCGDELEEWQSFSDAPLTRHQACGGKLAKVLSTPGIVLKGSGFYRTDSRNGSSKKPARKGDDVGGAAGDGSQKEPKAGDEKSEKSDTKAGSSDSTSSTGDGGKASPAKTGDTAS